jgi:hypothetical protein
VHHVTDEIGLMNHIAVLEGRDELKTEFDAVVRGSAPKPLREHKTIDVQCDGRQQFVYLRNGPTDEVERLRHYERGDVISLNRSSRLARELRRSGPGAGANRACSMRFIDAPQNRK